LWASRIPTDAFDELLVIDRNRLFGVHLARKAVAYTRRIPSQLEAGRAPQSRGTVSVCLPLAKCPSTTSVLATRAARELFPSRIETVPPLRADPNAVQPTTRRSCVRPCGHQFAGELPFIADLADDVATAINGVLVRDQDHKQEWPTADLIVEAPGRRIRTTDWLSNHGYPPPVTEKVPTEPWPIAPPVSMTLPTTHERCAARSVAYPGRGCVTRRRRSLSGEPARPSRNIENAKDLPDSMPIPIVNRLFDGYPLESREGVRYSFPSNFLGRHEGRDSFPEELLVSCDALARFNLIQRKVM